MSHKSIFMTIVRAVVVMTAGLWLSSCEKKDPNIGITSSEEGVSYKYPGNRIGMQETRNVLLFYECGFNSLYSDLSRNMEDELTKGYIPGGGRHENVLLVFSKFAKNGSYKDVPSYLRRLFKDSEGNVVSDTLKVFPESTVASSGKTMNEVLSFVRSTFPAKGYSMVYSSHGSGWLPTGYYNNPSEYERKHQPVGKKFSKASGYLEIPEGSMDKDDPYAWMVRSIGQDVMGTGSVEMSTTEFSEGIPFKLDFLLFDMCFSGGIEVVYPLREKADYLGVSPAEVLAQGTFDYTKITTFLLKGQSPDLTGLFKDSFDRYDRQSGDYRSSTVTLLNTKGLDEVAAACSTLLSKYSEAIANAPISEIQGYFRMNRHYFYDLEDIFVKSGVPDEDLVPLRNALQNSIVYKAATPWFISSFQIKTYSGLSMYLPKAGTKILNTEYKNESWNKDVGLVK